MPSLTDVTSAFEIPHDLLLRSSDALDFPVHKCVLEIASPVFRGLVSIPQPEDQEKKDGLPVVPVIQSGQTLHGVLAFCYPTVPPKPDAIDEVLNLLDAAQYYMIEGLQVYMRGLLVAPEFLKTVPIRVYAYGWKRGWKDVVAKAAEATLKNELMPSSQHSVFPEMEKIPASAIFRLFEFHRSCGDAAIKQVKLDTLPWTPHDWHRLNTRDGSFGGSYTNKCDCPDSEVIVSVVLFMGLRYKAKWWWIDYVEELKDHIKKVPGELKFDLGNCVSLRGARNCPLCVKIVEEELRVFNYEAVELAEYAVAKVPREFGVPNET